MGDKVSHILCVALILAVPGRTSATLIPSISISAEAASELSSETAVVNSVNGAGMLSGNYRRTHSNQRSGMWLSAEGGGGNSANHPFGLDCSTWVMYEFDQPYQLGAMRVYNYNESRHATAGLQNVYIHYSLVGGGDAGAWTNLGGPRGMFTFSQASGRYGERGKDEADFHGAFASYVLLTAAEENGNFGDTYYGLAEVQFDEVPEPATLLLLGFGSMSLLRKRRQG